MPYNPDDDTSQIVRLKSGNFAASDNEGTRKIFRTRYEAEEWLWNRNWGVVPKDKKYDRDTVKDEREASWKDVREKGLGLLEDDLVDVYKLNYGSISAQVLGYHDLYDTYVSSRAHVYQGNPVAKALWSCTCEWGQWCNSGHRPHDGPNSTGSVKVQNRFCSHAYAAYTILLTYRRDHVNIGLSDYDFSPEQRGELPGFARK